MKVYQVIEDYVEGEDADGESVIESCKTKEKAVEALENYMGDSDFAWEPTGEHEYIYSDESIVLELRIVELTEIVKNK